MKIIIRFIFKKMCDYISFQDSIKYGGGKPAYIEYVSDKQIKYFLENEEEIAENHRLIKNCDNPEETVDHLEKIVFLIKKLLEGSTLLPFKVFIRYDGSVDIYSGWHRIRAYQYLNYYKLPCEIIKD